MLTGNVFHFWPAPEQLWTPLLSIKFSVVLRTIYVSLIDHKYDSASTLPLPILVPDEISSKW